MFGIASRLRISARPLMHGMKKAAYHKPAMLPYKVEDGLTPFLSPMSLDFLQNMRQVELINNINRLTAGTEFEDKSLYDTIYEASQDPTQAALANNASQSWNINFFLQSLTSTSQEPQSSVQRLIGEKFRGFDKFKSVFTENALSMFGNGWTWLVINESGNLSVMNTYSATCPFTAVRFKAGTPARGITYATMQRGQINRFAAKLLPVLGISMWQEAFLPDYALDRAAYIDNFWKVVNWELVEQRVMSSFGSKDH